LVAGCPKADEAVFAANEFFGNAINHTESSKHPGGLVVVEVRRWRGTCAVLVTDQGGDSEPQTQVDSDPLSEHGRGLRAVGATATSWGWYGNRQSRTVTAVFAR
jgi:anti-sigma regulatory factor (Ser/Thr protein kinase)